MKKLILLLAIFLYPLQGWSLSEEGIKEFSQKAILDCDSYGSESCGARFMAMGACTYFISINKGKSNSEAMKIGDAMFVYMMHSHQIKPKILFNKDLQIKENIKNEFITRTNFCKSEIEKAVPLIFKETKGNDINEQPELKQRLVKAFPFWYLEALEKIIKEGNKLN